MVYQYLAVREGGGMVKGKLSAISEEMATSLLDYAGYRVISLKVFSPLFSMDTVFSRFSRAKPTEIILFYRQLALLLESGMDIISALEILRSQADKYIWRKVMRDMIDDLRAGNPLSKAMEKHPSVFSSLCRQSVRVGEQAGGIEGILRQVADYTQKELTAAKGIKSALTYPVLALIATVVVVAILLGFVLPAFAGFYDSVGAKLPAITRIMMDFGVAFRKYMLFIVAVLAVVVIGGVVYTRTGQGRLVKDRVFLKLPVLGRISHLKELSRACRSISLLYHAGLPLTEVMPLVVSSLSNRAIIRAVEGVHQDMLKGEGLSRPMMKRSLFLPMMVRMVKVGEETGNLDVTLLSVAEGFETEAKDKSDTLIALIQPTMTVVIGGIIGIIALSMISAMYSLYGQTF